MQVENLNRFDVIEICNNYYNYNNNNIKNNEINKIKLKSYDIKNVNYIEELNDNDDNKPKGFLAKHCLLNIKCKLINDNNKIINEHVEGEDACYADGDADNYDNLTFFIKAVPDDNNNTPDLIEYIQEFGVFKKEIELYNQLITPIQLKLNDVNISAMHWWSPKCYFTKNTDYLVLENLIEKNYQISKNSIENGILDYEHLSVALQTIATMHASSIIYEKLYMENNGKLLLSDLYKDALKENAYPDDKTNVRQLGFQNAVNGLSECIKFIDKYQNINIYNLNNIIQEFSNIMEKIFIFSKTSIEYRNVFSHGDLWCNNIMFYYEHTEHPNNNNNNNNECNNIPIKSRLVDFQLCRYAPPAYDVLTFITTTTTNNFRKNNRIKLLNEYYCCMDMRLKQYDIDIETEITRYEFDESCKYYELAGLIESCLFNHFILLPKATHKLLQSSSHLYNNFIRKSRVKWCLDAFQNDEIYRLRITDVLIEIIDNYILK